jgi:uncharacterized membrane protein
MAEPAQRNSEIVDTIKRANAEFLMLPTVVIGVFLAVAIVTSVLDAARLPWLRAARSFLESHFFSDGQATSDLLGAVATGLITLTSITISLLLIAVQQAAAAMSTQIFDQFMRRRINQFYFGFFVGLSLYALFILSTVTDGHNPVFGATVALLLTFVALYLLILLLYTTLDQMRPAAIIETIHDHVVSARELQHEDLERTKRTSSFAGPVLRKVRASGHGYIVAVDRPALEAALNEATAPAEITVCGPIGAFIARHDELAVIAAEREEDADRLEPAVAAAIHLERQRDIGHDAAYGIEQLETIAWTSISTSKQNPAPGLLVVHSLRDVLSRWAHEHRGMAEAAEARVVIPDDVMDRLMNAFESLAVVASESMQHQIFAEVLLAFASVYDRLPPRLRDAVDDRTLRVLSGLGDFVLTSELDAALATFAATLERAGRPAAALAVSTARSGLRRSRGQLNSRATRVSAGT